MGARLARWLWLPPAGAVCAFFLSLFWQGLQSGWPLYRALGWYFCCYCKYAAIPVGALGAAASVAAALSARRAGWKLLGWLLCGGGHLLMGLFLNILFQVMMSV